MMFSFIFVSISSVLLAKLICLIIRSKRSSKPQVLPVAVQSPDLPLLVHNPLFRASAPVLRPRHRPLHLVINGLNMPPRTTKVGANKILQDFLIDRFGLVNNISEVVFYMPGIAPIRSQIVAAVDEVTYHHVLLWKSVLLRASPGVHVDKVRSKRSLRHRFKERERGRHLPPPNTTAVPPAAAPAHATNPTSAVTAGPNQVAEPTSHIADAIQGRIQAAIVRQPNEEAEQREGIDPDREFEVEAIIGQKVENGRKFFQVRFVGYDQPEWCRADNVGIGAKREWWAANPQYACAPRRRQTQAQPTQSVPNDSSEAPNEAGPSTSQPRRSSRVALRGVGSAQVSQ